MTVFANKLEVSCQAQANKILAAFPDVCMTPPENPATPPGVPIPYPSFGMDSDTDKGTGTVKIGGKTVNQKNISYFTKTTGDEAGAAAKKGVISSKNTGKSYSQAFSMNVKAEGENLTRFSDISTNNHGSPPNVLPWPKIGEPWILDVADPCQSDKDKMAEACKGYESKEDACKEAGLELAEGESNYDGASDLVMKIGADGQVETIESKSKLGKTSTVDVGAGEYRGSKKREQQFEAAQQPRKRGKGGDGKAKPKKDLPSCLAASRCQLMSKADCDKVGGCCGAQTGHHLIPKSSFVDSNASGKKLAGCAGYDGQQAPCMCVEGASSTKGSHGRMHAVMLIRLVDATNDKKGKPDMKDLALEDGGTTSGRERTYGNMREDAKTAVEAVFPRSACDPGCIAAQLDAYHQSKGVAIADTTPLRGDATPGRAPEESRNMMADKMDLIKES